MTRMPRGWTQGRWQFIWWGCAPWPWAWQWGVWPASPFEWAIFSYAYFGLFEVRRLRAAAEE